MQRKRREFKRNLKCFFCESKGEKVPDYKDFEILKKFISERSKILSRQRSGVCAKHQRRLSKAIKRARHLAFIPFVS
ncbi:MAG: 30S ribosomal protein S18 [Candidatus Beckwithbacteria bacterium]|nr:30S ribosomal protein S18 [Patescibacteria group bacterium]